MNTQVPGQSVLEEIIEKLGPGTDKPFPDVDLIHGFLFRPQSGRWRLYGDLEEADYIEGAEADVGAMRTFQTLDGDTFVWLRVGAEVEIFEDGEITQGMARADTSSWHKP